MNILINQSEWAHGNISSTPLKPPCLQKSKAAIDTQRNVNQNIPVLSPELITTIFRLLSRDQPTLARLCRASRTFNLIATPILYSDFRQGKTWTLSEHVRLFKFLRTILQRQDLAHYTKHITLSQIDRDEVYGEDGLEATIFDLCVEQIDGICSGWLGVSGDEYFRKKWIDYAKKTLPVAILTVLLCSLPNLETLLFEESYEPALFYRVFNTAVSKLKEAHASGLPAPEVPFRKLHSFRTFSNEFRQGGWLTFADLCQFFNLPTTRSFEIALANGEWLESESRTIDKWAVAPRSSPIERLSFHYSVLTKHCLRKILGSCAHLREFQFTYGRIEMYIVDFTPVDLINQLMPHASSLQILGVNYDDDCDKATWNNVPTDQLRFNSDLRKFTGLKKLSVNNSLLLGFVVPDVRPSIGEGHPHDTDIKEEPEVYVPDLLPNSLEDLEIIGCDARIVKHLQEVIVAQAQKPPPPQQQRRYPNLSRIRCVMVQEKTAAADAADLGCVRGVTTGGSGVVDVTYDFLS